MRTTIFFLLLAVAAISSQTVGSGNKLPEDVAKALRSPEKAVLYSLEPAEQPSAQDEAFHHFKVLGRLELDPEQATAAGGEFQKAVNAWDNVLAMCFEPRQGLRLTAGGRTYDLLLCYSCHQLYVYEGDKLLAGIGAAGSPDVLNALLIAAKIKLAYTESTQDVAARQQHDAATRARWFAAMPVSVRPWWTGKMGNEFHPDLKNVRLALTKEYPGTIPRIQALFGWFGSGEGPWSGFPMYEGVAEQLLLDFSTSDLVTAAQAGNLRAEQWEGAARLFGGWDFFKGRPDDLKTLPPELKNKLLVHVLKSTDPDKRERAERAFKQP